MRKPYPISTLDVYNNLHNIVFTIKIWIKN